MTCIEKELDLLSREIFVTEQIDIHLVWTTGRIFLKSIPRFLLEPRFWTDYLSCTRGCRCHKEKVDSRGSDQQCDQRLWKRGAPSQPSATIFIAIVLTAMQAGLAINTLHNNHAFQSVSYGFTVFSILDPLITVGLILLTFYYIFISN
jgi:hypothetical protein